MSPWVAANLGAVFLELGQMSKSIPLEAPWEAKNAEKWDQITLAKWLSSNTMSKPAHDLLETALAGCYTSAASEVSMLFVLYQMASGGGPGFLLGVKDGAQDSRIVGGMGAVYRPMAAEIGDSLHLSQPVRRIDSGRRRRDGALRRHDGAGAAGDRRGAASRSPARSSTSPCCRSTGRSCISACRAERSTRSTSSTTSRSGATTGCPDSRRRPALPQRSPSTRRTDAAASRRHVRDRRRPDRAADRQLDDDRAQADVILAELVGRFGDKAASPVDYIEQMLDDRALLRRRHAQPRARPGVLTEFGHALARTVRPHPLGGHRELGRHVRLGRRRGPLGERAATEVMQRERVGVA